jgi:hypothetical protein
MRSNSAMAASSRRRTLGLVGAAALLAVAAASTSVAKPMPPAGRGLPGATASPVPEERAAVLVVIDGARWQDVLLGIDGELARDAGLDPRAANEPTMPRLAELARRRGAVLGAPGSGAAIRATGPNFVSLPGYTELMTGRSPRACQSNECPATALETIADAVRSETRSAREAAIFASWPDLVRGASAHPGSMVVSAGRSVRFHEAALRDDAEASAWLDRGARARPWPGDGDYRPDRFTAPLALRYLETTRPRFLFLSLGDTDEYAHRGDYAGYLDALRAADDTIGAIVEALDRMGTRGRNTTVYVTADHGRGRDFRDHGGRWPESSRVWLVAIGGGVNARGTIEGAEEHRLADVTPTIRKWLGLDADLGPDAGRPIAELLSGPRDSG